MKPCTYMNLSGEAVCAAMDFYKIPINRVIVVFDDTTLPLGKMRIRKKGSDGGHNGIKNIIYLSESKSAWVKSRRAGTLPIGCSANTAMRSLKSFRRLLTIPPTPLSL